MRNSHRFFENKECQYYPCHENIEEMNCMFCFCPMHGREKCPGNPEFIEVNNKRIKDCSNCTFPHKAENYDTIMKLLGSE